ncbi:MAG: peptide deformylase [Patescibacteria group bacterium]
MIQVIVQNSHPVLRKKAAPVPLSDIGSARLKKNLRDMQAALETQDDGVALAAPQISVSLRIFIVSKAALGKSPLSRGVPESARGRGISPSKGSTAVFGRRGVTPSDLKDSATSLSREDTKELKKAAGYLTFINPVITKLSREKTLVDEGCLSVRPLYGKVKRSKKAAIQAYDEHGKRFTRGASGLLAQIFQHECDHLDGVLFTDKASNLRELPPTSAD